MAWPFTRGRSHPGRARTVNGGASGSPEAPTTVIYIMGAGHSGSTVLGIALGNCAGFLYAGEVEEWLFRSGAPGMGGAERTRFWNSVGQAMNGQAAPELFGYEVNRVVERSAAVLRLDRWGARRRLLGAYRDVTAKLFRAIARTAGATHIVDSSHFPLRARELQRTDGVELYLIYLVRDPQDVVASDVHEIRRREVFERILRVLRVNADLWLTTTLSVLVFLRQPRARRVFVRHEEFLEDPELVVGKILEDFGLPVATPEMDALRVGVPIQGNRLIRTESIAIKRSARRAVRWSLLTAALQAPWSPVLARLRPAVTARSAPSAALLTGEHAPAERPVERG